jgi:hypothetical protein
MNKMAPMFLLAAALAGTPARGDAPLPATPAPGTAFKLAQFPYGRVCVTRIGACRIAPRPTKTQCFCGAVPGFVR